MAIDHYRHRRLSPTGTTLEPLEKQVYQRLKLLRPQFSGKKLILAISGGIDSVVLLYVLQALATRLGYSLHAVHVNHGVRGKAADADSEFVRQLCKKKKIPCSIKSLSDMKKSAGEGILRQKRYEALFEAREKLNAPFIVVAHHRDDLLETRMMRLLQGTGMHGLKAMTLHSEEGILRPLLEIPRSEIEQYARKKDLHWRNDATNEDTTKLRNWIRRNWIRVLKRDHPEYVDTFFNSLQRVVESAVATAPLGVFARQLTNDTQVYSYLRHHAQTRVTSRHVDEFKKRLRSPRNQFTFRLAGVDWIVTKDSVAPR